MTTLDVTPSANTDIDAKSVDNVSVDTNIKLPSKKHNKIFLRNQRKRERIIFKQSRLETLEVFVFNKKSGKTVKIRVFLDSGSNISAISEECALNCDLDFLEPEQLLISTCGRPPEEKNLDTTKVTLFQNDSSFAESMPVGLYVMKKLVGSLKTYELTDRQKNYMKNEKLDLADKLAGENGRLKIDILIGQDNLHNFHRGGPTFIPGGSVLTPTWGNKFILSGPIDPETKNIEPSDFVVPNFVVVHQMMCTSRKIREMGGQKKISKLIHNCYSCIGGDYALDELFVVDSFRNFELLGISPLDYKVNPLDEAFDESTVLKDGRYEVRLPFISPQILRLSPNFFQAFKRLLSGHRRRLKPKFLEEAKKYKESFDKEIELGILEKVECLGTMEEISMKLANNPQYFDQVKQDHNNPICYLPHQAVYKQSCTPPKFRRVHDGAARPGKGAYSLNDCLEAGPNLTSNILHILLGFRKNEFGAIADIEKAFPQISIYPKHRDALRCLWIENGMVNIYRFARLPFGLTCSPYLLQATLRKHLKDDNIDEETMKNFVSSIYVDDSVWSETSVEKLFARKKIYTEIFQKCSMNLRDWNSNHPEAKENWAKAEIRESERIVKSLGLVWDTEIDTLKINDNRLLEKINKNCKTKRDIWEVVPSIWDPLGLLSPCIVEGKKIVSKACKAVKGWDAALPKEILQEMKIWSSQFNQITNFSWPRWVGISNPKRIQLYGCCDASLKGLGACVYLVCTSKDDEISIKLIMGKTRTATKEVHSIPKLELASAVLLINVMSHVRVAYPEIEDKDIVYFSDSADCIFWIYSGHLSWRPFISNQLRKIRTATEVTQWRHIDGLENPADLASRGCTFKKLAESGFWNHGPDFWKTGDLSNGKSNLSGYDKHYKDLSITDACFSELQPESKRQLTATSRPDVTVAAISALLHPEESPAESGFVEKEAKLKISLSKIDNLVDPSKMKDSTPCSWPLKGASYDFLMFRTELFRKLGCGIVEKWKRWREAKNKPIPKNFFSEKLSFCSENAENLWIQAVQRKYFSEVFLLLENPKARVSSFAKSLLVNHTVFLDKEMKVLRCTTRNEKADVGYSTVFPILLPSSVQDKEGKWVDCEFTRKLVQKRHEDLGHAGVPETLANIRSEFWILRGRRFVQKVLKVCVGCKKVSGKPYSVPKPPCLPSFRVVRPIKPFAGVGLDFLGPFYCRESPKTKPYKGWYILFTCGSTRAIHLEAVKSRKIDDFLNALSRFISSHGIPESFISDHEKSFEKASESLDQIAKSNRVQKYLKSQRISWQFYTEKSPNKGGFIERLNAGVKKSVLKTLQKKLTTFEEFRTLACYVASTINDRPLTYLYSNIESECKALTPSMLICGYNKREPPHIRLYRPEDLSETKITEAFKAMERLKDRFWRIWNTQYLTDLYERHCREIKSRGGVLIVPKVGEVVLINEGKLPRRKWRLGRVVEVVEKRGSIREVVVQTLSPGSNLITKLKRSPDKLVPVGVSSEIVSFNEKDLVPLEIVTEISDQAILENAEIPKKYTKKEIAVLEKSLGLWRKKSKIWPPYKPSKQFLDPSSINTGPEPDYIDKGCSPSLTEDSFREWRR